MNDSRVELHEPKEKAHEFIRGEVTPFVGLERSKLLLV